MFFNSLGNLGKRNTEKESQGESSKKIKLIQPIFYCSYISLILRQGIKNRYKIIAFFCKPVITKQSLCACTSQ